MSHEAIENAGIDLGQVGAAVGEGWAVSAGPERAGNELRWRLTSTDGRAFVLAQLVHELTNDSSVRRRYRRDVARWDELHVEGFAQQLAWGPAIDEHDSAPWRLREAVSGEGLDTFLDRRAPIDPGEASHVLAEICDRLSRLHAHGLVVRDFAPSRIVLGEAGPVFVDVGLARVDILSTRTAASLVLEGSPYGAPEMLMRTSVDGRADLYGVGVLAFRLLTGALPFGDTHALLRPPGPAPAPSSIRPGLPAALDHLVVSLLAADPAQRPPSAGGVAAMLRGELRISGGEQDHQACQNCSATMPLGQRLCLSCGAVGVQFETAPDSLAPRERWKVVLKKAKDEREWVANFADLAERLSDGSHGALEFMVGDPRMYSREEQARRLRAPTTLFIDLEREVAQRIHGLYEKAGIKTRVEKLDAFDRAEGMLQLRRPQVRVVGILGVGTTLAAGVALAAGGAVPAAVATAIGGLVCFAAVMASRGANRKFKARWGRRRLGLRQGPAALPASDPLVAKLAALLEEASAPDVEEAIGAAALSIQQLVDHRAANLNEAAEVDIALAPIHEVVEHTQARVRRLAEIDAELKEHDEGVLVRELAASRARAEPEAAQILLLNQLDRLRELEEERARLFAGLLDAQDLIRRGVELGLSVQDPAAEHERQVQAALQRLSLPAA